MATKERRTKGANGNGGASKRADGSWQWRVTLDDGRRIYGYGKTQDEAKRKCLDKAKQAAAGIDVKAARQTLGEFLETWLADVVKPQLAPKTYASYRDTVRKHVTPALGRFELGKLTPRHVQSLLRDKERERKYSPQEAEALRLRKEREGMLALEELDAFQREKEQEPMLSPRSVGYNQLERSERSATQHAISIHRREAVMWYRLLAFYYRALDVPSIRSDDAVWLTQWKILRLGLTATKSAIDATLAGYYVSAFGDIRQLTEYWFGIQHLQLKPETVNGYYAAPEGEPQPRLPYMGARIRDVLAAFESGGAFAGSSVAWFVNRINATYKRMSDGHHLDGLAMVQTGAFDDSGYFLGAGYHPRLAAEALYNGVIATGALGMAAALIMERVNPGAARLVDEINAAFGESLETWPEPDQETDDEQN